MWSRCVSPGQPRKLGILQSVLRHARARKPELHGADATASATAQARVRLRRGLGLCNGRQLHGWACQHVCNVNTDCASLVCEEILNQPDGYPD